MARYSRVCAVVLVTLAAVRGWGQEEPRYHGTTLDETHQLIIKQYDNICMVGIIERGRSTGPDLVDVVKPALGASARVTGEPKYLVEIRSEVLVPSAPNYLQNPGERYRITIETVDFTPAYQNSVEVWAQDARDSVLYQFYRLATETTGIDRKALETAGPLVLDVFKEAQLLPAEIYTSVLRSRSGLFRITPETRQRRRILPSETFAPRPDFGRPELGATLRERQRRSLPSGATAPGSIAGPTPKGKALPQQLPNEPGKPPSIGVTPTAPLPPGAAATPFGSFITVAPEPGTIK